MTLEKAQFIAENNTKIEFLFNPTKITVTRSFETKCEDGTGGGGLPKVNYKGPNASTVRISEIWTLS